ncbi:MFS transporter [Providencia sp. Me31A]|uniref:MFS transporter n=1 Tax=Providencia sp. Me31A TaxID=3392637 RepID=UPI003D2709F7
MKIKDIIVLITLGMAGGTIYLLPYMKYYFYNQMIDNTGLSGQNLGFLVTMFGISSMVVLLPGGVLADRLSSRKCIFLSLISTALLTVAYSFAYKSYVASLIIWFLLAFTTLFLAWPAIFKAVRIIGGENSSTAYSIYYASNGLTGAIAGYITIKLYSVLSVTDQSNAYFWGIWVSVIANIVVAVALYYLLRDMKDSTGDKGKLPTIHESFSVLKMPIIWVITLALFCTYTLYVGMTFFTPYLTSAFGVSDETSGTLSLVRSYIFMSLTPLTGIIADKYFKSTLKWFLVVCPIVAISLLIIILIGERISFNILVMSLTMFAAFFVCTIYASMFSILSECKIPIAVAGTAIGLVSVFAYTPDSIMQPLFGYFADNNQYNLIFITLLCAAILACLSCLLLLMMNKKNSNNNVEC